MNEEILELHNEIIKRKIKYEKLVLYINSMYYKLSKLKIDKILKKNKINKELEKNLKEQQILKNELEKLLLEESKLLKSINCEEKIFIPIYYFEGLVLKEKHLKLTFDEFKKMSIYQKLTAHEKALIENCEKYFLRNNPNIQLNCSFDKKSIELNKIRFLDLDSEEYVEASLNENMICLYKNKEYKFIEGEKKGLTQEEIVNINKLVEQAREYISCGKNCTEPFCKEIFKFIEKQLSYATPFQKAQLPKIDTYMLGSKIHYSFSQNFVDLKKVTEDPQFSSNEQYVVIINKISNYFMEVFNEQPLIINMKIDSNGKLLTVTLRSNKTINLPVVDCDDQDLIAFNYMVFDFETDKLSIVKKDYYKIENNTNITIPMPKTINSYFEQKKKVLRKVNEN